MAGKRRSSVITTILGRGCVVNGDFMAEESVRIDGDVIGNVKVTGALVVGSGGRIHGNVEAREATIGGEVVGNVQAPEKVELTATAKIIGDITTNVIVIDEHAVFHGKCDMNQETPRKKNAATRKAVREGRRSAKAALQEALREVQEESKALQEEHEQAVPAAETAAEEKSEV